MGTALSNTLLDTYTYISPQEVERKRVIDMFKNDNRWVSNPPLLDTYTYISPQEVERKRVIDMFKNDNRWVSDPYFGEKETKETKDTKDTKEIKGISYSLSKLYKHNFMDICKRYYVDMKKAYLQVDISNEFDFDTAGDRYPPEYMYTNTIPLYVIENTPEYFNNVRIIFLPDGLRVFGVSDDPIRRDLELAP